MDFGKFDLKRENFGSGAPLEKSVGYSRMIKIGPYVEIGGTTSVQPDGSVYAAHDSNGQVRYILQKQLKLLESVGAKKEDVIRIKMYLAPDYGKYLNKSDVPGAYSAIFHDVMPLNTAVTVYKLTRPEQLVEIEMAAVIGCGRK